MGQVRFAFIIVLWLASIGCDPSCPVTTTVVVSSTEGKPLPGAKVSLDGCCPARDCVRTTGDGGVVIFPEAHEPTGGECTAHVEYISFKSASATVPYTCKTGEKTGVNIPVTLSR